MVMGVLVFAAVVMVVIHVAVVMVMLMILVVIGVVVVLLVMVMMMIAVVVVAVEMMLMVMWKLAVTVLMMMRMVRALSCMLRSHPVLPELWGAWLHHCLLALPLLMIHCYLYYEPPAIPKTKAMKGIAAPLP